METPEVDPHEILSRLGSEDNAPTDAELHQAVSDFKALGRKAVEAKQPEEAATIRQAVKLLEGELEARAEAEAEEAAKAAEFLADFADDQVEVEEEDDDDTDDEVEAEEDSGALDALRMAVENNRARIDADAKPDNPYPHVQVRSVGHAANSALDYNSNIHDVASLFAQHAKGGRDTGRQTYVHMNWEYDEDRQLGENVEDNYRVIENVLNGATSFEAVAAAGGICGPLETVYDIPLIGSRGRPVRDALTRFGASRGGVRYNPAPRLSLDPVAGSVAVWTSENDVSPSSPESKPCPHVDCATICEAQVDAITACLVVGNFQARFSSEQWANLLAFLGVEHDRVAEQALLADLDAGSIDVTFDSGLGTIPNVLGAIDRAIAGIRSRDRLSNAAGFRVILDGWLRPALRSQFTVQTPAGQTTAPGLSDAQIDQYFAARGATVSYTLDDNIFGAQADGVLAGFPANTEIRVFPEGTWWFLDGGTLDLGTEIVDSTLIAQNDRQAFMETFEKAAKRTAPCDAEGDDSLHITVPVSDECIDACVTSP